jgi:type I restriction enzyme, S subunit
VGDVGDGGQVATTGLKRIARDIADQFAKTYLRGGELLLSLVGTIGRTAVVPVGLAGANVARAIGVLPLTGEVSTYWVENWFRSPGVRAEMTGKAHEVARKTLNLEDVRAATVALPPALEQRRIVESVDRMESDSSALEGAAARSVLRATRLRQAILRWAFEGRLVDQDPNDESAAVLLDRLRAERAAKGTTVRKPRKTRSKR